MIIKGKVFKFGDNINTDEIIPARYLNTSDTKELGKHCMEGIDTSFAARIAPGDIVVAGKNFGCGSSREHAPVSLKACGISLVIAESFARIFYRNAINIGLPILELAGTKEKISAGEMLKVDLEKGEIVNIDQNEKYSTQPFPEFMEKIISAGGLMNHVKKQMRKKQ